MRPSFHSLPFLIVLLSLYAAGQLSAQGNDPAHLLRYRFKAGDSVVYRVHAVDSIGLFDVHRRTVMRERISIISYHCDSVLADGSYIMSWRYHAYGATERIDTLPPVTRETHPWVGRTATFRMTPGGLRTTMYRWDKTSEASPGGPMEPLALPWIGDDSVKFTYPGNTSYSGKNWLFENSFPPALFDGIMMRSADPIADTAGRRVLPIELSTAGTIAYVTGRGEDSILTQAVIQSGGTYKLGVKEGYPLAGQIDLIARLKLTITHDDEQKVIDGRHTITTVFELLWPKPLKVTPPKRRRR